ncbi:MAG TPA: sigma factor [Nocardioides sp.]|nr:sigma factor [Nocardioides sp.]
MAGRPHAHDDSRPGLEQLLLLSGRGDVQAFADLYDELAPRVFGLVTCLVRDAATAEAVTEQAFLETWRRAPTYDPTTSSARAWVLALAHRLAVRAGRLSDMITECAAPVLCAADSPLLAAGMSRGQADAVHLAYFEGLDHGRIARLLDTEEPVPVLVTGGLEVLATADARQWDERAPRR